MNGRARCDFRPIAPARAKRGVYEESGARDVTWDGEWDDASIDWSRLHEPRHHYELVDELHARGLVRLPSEAHRHTFASLVGSILSVCSPHTLPPFRRAIACVLTTAWCGADGAVHVAPFCDMDIGTLKPYPTRSRTHCPSLPRAKSALTASVSLVRACVCVRVRVSSKYSGCALSFRHVQLRW